MHMLMKAGREQPAPKEAAQELSDRNRLIEDSLRFYKSAKEHLMQTQNEFEEYRQFIRHRSNDAEKRLLDAAILGYLEAHMDVLYKILIDNRQKLLNKLEEQASLHERGGKSTDEIWIEATNLAKDIIPLPSFPKRSLEHLRQTEEREWKRARTEHERWSKTHGGQTDTLFATLLRRSGVVLKTVGLVATQPEERLETTAENETEESIPHPRYGGTTQWSP